MKIVEYKRNREAMATRFEVRLRGEDEEHLEAVAVAVLEEVVRLDGVLSRYDPRSEVARLNRHAGRAAVRVDREVFALLKQCEAARQFTNGCFDVTATSPQPAALILDEAAGTVQFEHPDTAIDLGGVAKGFALDGGREILRRFGVTCALLDGGTSSVVGVGEPEHQGGWPIRICRDGQAAVQVNLQNRAFSCSSVRRANQTVSDVTKPHTGGPLDGDATCYVLAGNATEAEIYSTALLVMGRVQATSFLAQHTQLDLAVGWMEGGEHFTLRST